VATAPPLDVAPSGSSSAGPQPRERAPRRPLSPAWLVAPALVVLALAFAYPTLRLLLRSVTEDPGFIHNYQAIFSDSAILKIVLRSLWTAAVVTVIALVVGYAYTYAALKSGPRLRAVLLTIVAGSLFVSIVVRGYAWLAILDRNGALQAGFKALGFDHFQPTLVRNFTGVIIGMVQYGIPFMVLALYDVTRRIDPRLMQASAMLGAGPFTTFRKVFLPLSMPGVIAGCLIVFITTLGYYILPSILGGPQNTMVGEVIATKLQTTLDWAGATSLAGVLLLVSIIGFVAFIRVTRRAGGVARGV
jgi:ABC-type spermidine/putrescine transport system permease subunit I